MTHFLISWIVSAFALLITSKMISGVHVEGFIAAMTGALALGLVNLFIKPLLIFLSLPFTIVTFGLFLFVVTGIVFWLAAKIAPGFSVDGFGSAMLGSLVLTLVNWLIGILFYRSSF